MEYEEQAGQKPQKIAIVGSGLVGSLLAVYLIRRGHRVDIFDRRPDIRTVEFSGRSINLAMSTRGWQALEQVGLADRVREIAIPLYSRTMHPIEGDPYEQPYGSEGQAIWSISRGLLNRRMIDLAEEAGANFFFNEKVWDVDLPSATLYTGETEKGAWKEYGYDRIFGCDGAFSRVRHKMQRRSRFNYSQHFIELGYKELTIPPNPDGSHKLDKHTFHIWPRGKFMLIAMPNTDGSFTCTLFLPHEGKQSFENITTKKEAKKFFKEYFPNVRKDIENLTTCFFDNATSALVTMKCYPWTYWDKVALVGDSAHAVVPFFGQGMNAGFEDIYVLDQLCDQYGDDWEAIFTEYQESRKPNADAIAELSYRNFEEMSTRTADPEFLLQKRIERRFSEKYPELWVPAYSRVTFSNEPYSEALKEGDRQNALMRKVLSLPDIENRWDSAEVEDFMLGLIQSPKAVKAS